MVAIPTSAYPPSSNTTSTSNPSLLHSPGSSSGADTVMLQERYVHPSAILLLLLQRILGPGDVLLRLLRTLDHDPC